MQGKDPRDTKEKILEVAAELFGRYGFEGTSVRAISKQSGVNLAAMNYHFTSKDTLFWEVMARTYVELDSRIAELAKTSKNTVELALKTFDHFQAESLSMKIAMKMMLDEAITPPKSPEIQKALANPMGPPGGLYFAQAIQNDVGYPLSREGLLWGVKSTFGTVFHWGIILCTGHCDRESDPLMSPEQIRRDVEHMIMATMLYLNNGEKLYREG